MTDQMLLMSSGWASKSGTYLIFNRSSAAVATATKMATSGPGRALSFLGANCAQTTMMPMVIKPIISDCEEGPPAESVSTNAPGMPLKFSMALPSGF